MKKLIIGFVLAALATASSAAISPAEETARKQAKWYMFCTTMVETLKMAKAPYSGRTAFELQTEALRHVIKYTTNDDEGYRSEINYLRGYTYGIIMTRDLGLDDLEIDPELTLERAIKNVAYAHKVITNSQC